MIIPRFGHEAHGLAPRLQQGLQASVITGRAPCPFGHAKGREFGSFQSGRIVEKRRIGWVGAGVAAFNVIKAEIVQHGGDFALFSF